MNISIECEVSFEMFLLFFFRLTYFGLQAVLLQSIRYVFSFI